MSDNERTPQQLQHENEQLRAKVAALEAVEARFRATFEQAVIGIAHVGLDGSWLLVNQRLCDIVGYSPAEMQQLTLQRLTLPEDVEGDVGAIQALIAGEIRKYASEKRCVRRDGSVAWVFLAVTLVRDSHGAPAYFVAVIEDIDERKRIEAQLVFSSVVLATQQETSLDGILVVGEQGKILSSNRRFVDMWGIPEDVIATRSHELALRAVLDKLVDPAGFVEKVEYLYAHRQESSTDEIVLRDDRRFERYSAPMLGPDARYFGRVWYFRDLTEQRRLEESLRLTQFSVDSAADAILWVSRDALLCYANDAMCRLLGYSREEMLELKVFDIDASHTPQSWSRRWEDAIQQGALSAESSLRRKDGTTVQVEITSGYIELAGKSRLCAFIRDISQRKRTEEELFRLATTDSLTGVLNRRYFLERCGQEIQRSKRYGGRLSALMLDIDHFKRINDTSGHAAGDVVLRTFAELCAVQLRTTDLFGRLGGEEFAISLPETSAEGALVAAERLRKAICEACVSVKGTEIRFTVSIGVTELDPEDRDVDDIHTRADEAMYAAKEQGRNRVVLRRRGTS